MSGQAPLDSFSTGTLAGAGCFRCGTCGFAVALHELSSHRRVCQLCLARLPESKRETIASERIHVSDRPLLVAPRAA